MAKPSYTLLDDFALKGIWWLPEQPDLQISGTLLFENEKKISLELLGSFHELKTFGAGNFFQPEIILGVTDNGLICTLFRNFETRNQLNIPGIQNSIIESQYLFIGKHFNARNEICFSSLQVNFTNLENWLALTPFSMEIPDKIKNGVWKLIHKWPSEFIAKIEKFNSKIESTHEFKTEGDHIRNAIWKSKAYLKITPDKPKHFKWYWSVIYDLCNFLTLLIGATTYITHVKAYGDDIEINPGQKTKETIELFFTQKKPGINEGLHPFEMIIPFPRIAEKIDKVISLWFSKSQDFRSVYDLFFGTFYNPGMYLQFQFLSLMQAIESFHRVTKVGKYLSDEDWKPYREKLANEISVELDSGHRESLKSRIKYGNEYSLRKRLSELLQSIDGKTLSVLSPTNKYFTGIVVDTRHYLTHYDDELKDSSLKGADLYWANQRLRIFLTILLLKEIDIEENVILESMKENNKINQIFNKRQNSEPSTVLDAK
jgi:hypothetical protein